MKIKIELAAGPLWVEIEADGEEDYVGAVEDVVKIIEDRDFDVEESVSDTDSESMIQPTLEESTEGNLGGRVQRNRPIF